MKVCVLTTCYPRFPGDGAGAFVHSLMARLARDHGAEPLVVAPHQEGLPLGERMDGVEVRRFRYAWPTRLQALAYGGGIPDNIRASRLALLEAPGFMAALAAAAVRHSRGADLVHAQWVETSAAGLLAARLRRRPLITTVHSLLPGRAFGALYRRLLPRADRVIFNSSFTAATAAELGVECRGEVVFQGVDVERFASAEGGGWRERLDVPDGALLVAAVGRLIELKGHAHLIRAVAGADAPLHLVIAGGGPEEENLRGLAAELGATGRVHLLGVLPGDEVPGLLADADVFAHPAVVDSRGRTEAMGLAVCEALAAGLPAVVSRAGGLPDLVEDGVSGRLVPPDDVDALRAALEELAGSPELRRRLGAAARERAERLFSWRSIAARTAEIYRAACGA